MEGGEKKKTGWGVGEGRRKVWVERKVVREGGEGREERREEGRGGTERRGEGKGRGEVKRTGGKRRGRKAEEKIGEQEEGCGKREARRVCQVGE